MKCAAKRFKQRKRAPFRVRSPPPPPRARHTERGVAPPGRGSPSAPFPRHPRSPRTGCPCGHLRDRPRRASPRARARDPLAARAAAPIAPARLACRASASSEAPTDWGLELSSAVVRVGAGVFMVHNGLDKLADPEGFAKFVVEPYRILPHDDPLSFVTWTYLAAGAELAGAAGLRRPVDQLCALSLFSTMALAVYFHVAQSGLEDSPGRRRETSVRPSPPRSTSSTFTSSTEGEPSAR